MGFRYEALLLRCHARHRIFAEPILRVLNTGVLQAGNQDARQGRRLDRGPHIQSPREQARLLDESGRGPRFWPLLERQTLPSEKTTVRQRRSASVR
jgi:hypothetical protein